MKPTTFAACALAAVLIGGYLLWVAQGRVDYAPVGACVAPPSAGVLRQESCDASGALRLLGKFPGDDSDQCLSVTGTTRVFVEHPTSSTSFILCAAPAASAASAATTGSPAVG